MLAQSAPVRYTKAWHAGQDAPPLSDSDYFAGAYNTAIGSKGEIYAGGNSCIFRIAADGSISRYAGICGVGTKSDDGGPATKAALWSGSIGADQAGNLYIAEWSYNRIRKVAPDGTISTLTGTGADGCTGDGGLAVNAAFGKPSAIAVDTKGTIYANCDNSIRRISPDGKITTLIVLHSWEYIDSLACDQAGNVYAMADSNGSNTYGLIHRISPDGTDVVIAGAGYSREDGVLAIQSLIGLSQSIAVDADGNVYIVDGPRIRRIDKAGTIDTIAGNGAPGIVDDGGAASAASQISPFGLAIDLNGNLVFEDSGRGVRRILLKATPPRIELVVPYSTAAPEDGPRATATFGDLAGIARDKSGNLYVADERYRRIRKIGTDDMVTTIAGDASSGFDGDGEATAHSLSGPFGIDFDSQGNLWFGDGLRLRKVTSSGIMSTEAGTGVDGCVLNVGGGRTCYLSSPSNVPPLTQNLLGVGFVRVSPLGAVFFVNGTIYRHDGMINPNQAGQLFELNNGKLSEVTASAVSTAPPSRFGQSIAGMTFDASGNTYVATNYSIQKIDTTGVLTTFAGTPGKRGSSGDGGPATAALLATPSALASDSQGNIYFIDGDPTAVIRKISRGGALIETIAGGGNGPLPAATADNLSGLTDLVVDPAGVIYATYNGLYVLKFTPVQADGISILSGDRQIGSLSTQLPQPLVVGISGGSGSLPFAAVAVQFKIASGVAKLSSDTVITGADGTASVTVTLGSQTGPVVITASVPGLASANFTLTVQVPCSFTLDPAAISVPATGAQGSIALTAAPAVCMWSAESRDVWATLTSAATGTGSAIIAYTVAPNPGAARTSAFLIAGASVTVSQQAGPPGPLILRGGVVGAGGSVPAVTRISPGGLATIYGANFAPPGTSRQVQAGDLVGSNLPTQLAGVCVAFNAGSKPVGSGWLTYVSPAQVNFQVPSLPLNTDLNMVVSANCGTAGVQTAVQTVTADEASPEFLYWVKNADGRNPVIAVNSLTGAYVGRAGLIAGASFTPAKPGDYLTIYGISFGPTTPAAPPGTAPGATAATTNAPAVMLGTSLLDATNVLYAGVSPGTAGLYQLNIRVPDGLNDGDYPITLRLGSFVAPPGGYLTVKNIQVNDFSFEQLVLPGAGWGKQPNQPSPGSSPEFSFPSNYAGWSFTGNSGVTLAGTDFNAPSNIPDGLKVALLQGNWAAVNQAISGLKPAVTYTVFLHVGTRYHDGGGDDGNTSVDVKIDGTLIGTTGLLPSSSPFSRYSFTFTVSTPGSHDLSISNSGPPGDHTAFVDSVSITDTIQP